MPPRHHPLRPRLTRRLLRRWHWLCPLKLLRLSQHRIAPNAPRLSACRPSISVSPAGSSTIHHHPPQLFSATLFIY
ncbi:hypothetical protein DENSPDRAFT_310952 [Dentipellis sp. KUC8613]|nr:hypothetical protein DENSPDRAFT_310952 [Dentipellis sp. KUC8613]